MAIAHNNRSKQEQAKLLTAVLAGVLGVSIACAYLITQKSRGPIRRAEKILTDLRATGLSAYWSDKAIELTYDLLNADGKKLAHKAAVRKPIDGGYRGIIDLRRQSSKATEAWYVSEDVYMGLYEVESNLGRFIVMGIAIEGDDLTVSTPGFSTQAKAPANYIPEGLMDLVIYLTALTGKDATFSTIANEHALAGKKVRFFQVQIKPQDENNVAVYMPGLRGTQRMEYKLGSDGIVHEIILNSQGDRFQLTEKRIFDPSEESSTPEE